MTGASATDTKMDITYATLCSGIEGFGLGFDRAGMRCVFQSEADKDCRRILEKHYPDTERTADVNDPETERALRRLRPGVVAFGSPCQDLSVAGKRGGLAGQRSGLFFRCVELCFSCEAGLVVWENVPGVFSSAGGQDFASVLEAFTGYRPTVPPEGWRNTGVCVGPLYSVAWAVLDAQWFGVPQRRRRVFLVGSLGRRSGPYEILSLGESLPWNSPPSREQGAGVAYAVAAGSGGSKFGSERDGQDTFVAGTLNSGGNSGGFRTEPGEHVVTHALTGEGFDASEDGTGRGTPLVAFGWNKSPSQTMQVSSDATDPVFGSRGSQPAIAYQCHGSNVGPMGTLRSGNGNETGGVPFTFQTRFTRNDRGGPSDVVPALTSCEGGTHADTKPHVTTGVGIRRLTPRECERLMGFPDDWTRFDAAGKELADSPRYRMCGNSIVINCSEWIGRRIVAQWR